MDVMSKYSHLHILSVEDSRTQAAQLRFILEKHGFKVHCAGNGQEAIAVLDNLIPDIVITDIVMPEMDGYELCKYIRNDHRLKEVPIILVTTLSDPTDVIRGLEVGANMFITKPYDENHLITRIHHLITNTELRKDMKAEMGINVYFAGQNFFITAERLQILDLLLSTYENAYHQYRELLSLQKDLTELNIRLEDIVKERTAELLDANNRLKIELAERLRAEEEKVKLQAQLHQAQRMESVGRLAGGVAHDYNNMLSVILGYTHMALQEVDPQSSLYENLEEILTAAKRSTGITRQLLAFARKQTLSPQVLDLNEAVTGMINMIRQLIGEDIKLSWTPADNCWPVRIDPSQLDQVLANLCVNARDAIVGVGEVRIRTGMANFAEQCCMGPATVAAGEYVFLFITDSGCGMDQEILDRIFDPFFTTKEVGKGTGLGLATVYGIIEQHKGFIDVDSEPGKGTTFKIYLPRHQGPIGTTQQNGNGNIYQGQGETVLIVEDEEAILKLTGKMMKSLGYTVLMADSPSKALALAQDHTERIQLLLSDIIMPEMNGPDLAAKLQADDPQLKCLFMSGYAANIIAGKGVLEKKMPFIQKPFSVKMLGSKVREVLTSSDPH